MAREVIRYPGRRWNRIGMGVDAFLVCYWAGTGIYRYTQGHKWWILLYAFLVVAYSCLIWSRYNRHQKAILKALTKER